MSVLTSEIVARLISADEGEIQFTLRPESVGPEGVAPKLLCRLTYLRESRPARTVEVSVSQVMWSRRQATAALKVPPSTKPGSDMGGESPAEPEPARIDS